MPAIAKLLEQYPDIKLPTPPAVALQIINEVRKEEPSFTRLTEIISADPALATKVLRIANSAMMSPVTPIDSLDKALTRMGISQTTNIALSFALVNELRGSDTNAFDYDYFWKRSLTTAVGANIIARKIKLRCDHIFISGLLRDIGLVIACLCIPEYHEIFVDKRESIDIAEQKFKFDFTHNDLGSEVLIHWGIPEQIAETVRFHNRPDDAPAELADSIRIVHVAGLLSALFHGRTSAHRLVAARQVLQQHYHLDIHAIDTLIDEISASSGEILSLFHIDGDVPKTAVEILQEANEELFRLNMTASRLADQYHTEKQLAQQASEKLHEANAELSRLAFQDSLTGLYNLRYFHDCLERELRRANRYNKVFSLIMFDIDDFKQVNDTYGHQAGDKVLREIAATATISTRTTDVVVRYGGEEFAIILPETDIDTAATIAERLREGIANMRVDWNDKTITVTASVGVSYFCSSNARLTANQLIAVADAGLYRSKRCGKNCVSLPQ